MALRISRSSRWSLASFGRMISKRTTGRAAVEITSRMPEAMISSRRVMPCSDAERKRHFFFVVVFILRSSSGDRRKLVCAQSSSPRGGLADSFRCASGKPQPQPQEGLEELVVKSGHADIHEQSRDDHDEAEAHGQVVRWELCFEAGAAPHASAHSPPDQKKGKQVISQICEEPQDAEFFEDIQVFGISNDSGENCFGGTAAEDRRVGKVVESVQPEFFETVACRIRGDRVLKGLETLQCFGVVYGDDENSGGEQG